MGCTCVERQRWPWYEPYQNCWLRWREPRTAPHAAARAYPTDPATTWHLWLKWVTVDNVPSSIPAGGTNGVVVTTGEDVALLLTALAGKVTTSQLFSTLNTRIDLIDVGPAALTAKVADLATTYANTASSAASAAAAVISAATAAQAKIDAVSSAATATQAKADAITAQDGAANSATTAIGSYITVCKSQANRSRIGCVNGFSDARDRTQVGVDRIGDSIDINFDLHAAGLFN